ncbi:MAG TPA: hypothetical protein VF145_09560 [Chitinophagaceae bacterium]
MKKMILVCTLLSAAVCGCNNRGEKLMINDKSELYYKGDNVSADEAKRLGDFLLRNNYFDTISKKTVQLTKTVDTFNIRFAVDEDRVKNDAGAEMLFSIMGSAISSMVYNGKPVKVILADQEMKDFKTFPVTGSQTEEPSLPAGDTTVTKSDSVQPR